MLDIGFPELLLVSIVALLVIGPERLPETIRTVSLWVGRFKRSLAKVREEIEAEVGADDIRRQLRQESVLQGLEDTKAHLEEMIANTKKDLEETGKAAKEPAAVRNESLPPAGNAGTVTSDANAETADNDEHTDRKAAD